MHLEQALVAGILAQNNYFPNFEEIMHYALIHWPLSYLQVVLAEDAWGGVNGLKTDTHTPPTVSCTPPRHLTPFFPISSTLYQLKPRSASYTEKSHNTPAPTVHTPLAITMVYVLLLLA